VISGLSCAIDESMLTKRLLSDFAIKNKLL
jgi:hypothetical protein